MNIATRSTKGKRILRLYKNENPPLKKRKEEGREEGEEENNTFNIWYMEKSKHYNQSQM
jgi:hypothetical protein